MLVLLQFQLNFWIYSLGAFAATNARSKRRSARERTKRNHKDLSPQSVLKISQMTDAQTNADVLRAHGLLVLADWAENALIAPKYARQSQYWASVLWEPEIPEFAEWPMEGARGLEFDAEDEAELPEADLPLLVPVFGAIPAVVLLNTSKISAPPACLPTRANTEMRPNHPTTGGRSRVHFLLDST